MRLNNTFYTLEKSLLYSGTRIYACKQKCPSIKKKKEKKAIWLDINYFSTFNDNFNKINSNHKHQL